MKHALILLFSLLLLAGCVQNQEITNTSLEHFNTSMMIEVIEEINTTCPDLKPGNYSKIVITTNEYMLISWIEEDNKTVNCAYTELIKNNGNACGDNICNISEIGHCRKDCYWCGGLSKQTAEAITLNKVIKCNNFTTSEAWYSVQIPENQIINLTINNPYEVYLYKNEEFICFNKNTCIISAEPDTYYIKVLRGINNNTGYELSITGSVSNVQNDYQNNNQNINQYTGESHKILIVDDDDSNNYFYDNMTSADTYYNILFLNHNVTLWSTLEEGSPGLFKMRDYDMVIWCTGDHYNKAPDVADKAALQTFLNEGGGLFITGSWISYDHRGDVEFLNNFLHINYSGVYRPLHDIRITNTSSPITKNFTEGQAIRLQNSPGGYVYSPDVVKAVNGSTELIERGFMSQGYGNSTLIAYESNNSKMVYMAFPGFLIPEPQRTTLLNNIVEWLG